MKIDAMADFVDMTSYSNDEKYTKDNYDEQTCYCGNKFLKFRIKEFNKVCFLHDHEYDVINIIAHMIKEENVTMSNEEIIAICSNLKLLADQRFRVRLKRESVNSLKLRIFTKIGYFMVRMLKDSYPIRFKRAKINK